MCWHKVDIYIYCNVFVSPENAGSMATAVSWLFWTHLLWRWRFGMFPLFPSHPLPLRQSHLNHGRKQAGDRCSLEISKFPKPWPCRRLLPSESQNPSVAGDCQVPFDATWQLCHFSNVLSGLVPISSNSLGSWFLQVSLVIVPWISKEPAQKISEVYI